MPNILLYLIFLTTPLFSLADDIEIYRGENHTIIPSVMFVLDTSGSMAYPILVDAPYDPTLTYDLSTSSSLASSFDTSAYYYSDRPLLDSQGDYQAGITYIKSRKFHLSSLQCRGNAVDDVPTLLQRNGYMVGQFLRWDTRSRDWLNPTRYNADISSGFYLPLDASAWSGLPDGAHIECRADEGQHAFFDGVTTRPTYIEPSIGINRDSNWFYLSQKADGYDAAWNNPITHLYSGNYLNYQLSLLLNIPLPERTISRMELTIETMNEVVSSLSNAKVGLLRFADPNYNEPAGKRGTSGGVVELAVQPVEEFATKLLPKINDYIPWGATPFTEAMHEAAHYLSGKSIVYGNNNWKTVLEDPNHVLTRDPSSLLFDSPINDSNINYLESTSEPNSRNGDIYRSPITSACDLTSTIIMFSDGEPFHDFSSNEYITNLIQDVDFPAGSGLSRNCAEEYITRPNVLGVLTDYYDGICAAEYAYYLYNFDQNEHLDGMQRIKTHVVAGFLSPGSSGIDLLKEVALHGGGTYFTADDYITLSTALTKIFTEVSDKPSSFVAPAVAANSYNSLEHLDELYYAVFEPSSDGTWAGNLKQYRLSGTGKIVDANANNAVDDSGLFKSGSRSYWTPDGAADGSDVRLGGAASLLENNNKIYTFIATPGRRVDYFRSQDLLSTSNITAERLGLASDTPEDEIESYINWANRFDSGKANSSRTEMEDPLHSRPIVISYNTEKSAAGYIEHESAVFIGTNSGYLHALKASQDEFEEYFSFIPEALLPNIVKYKDNEEGTDKVYGMDGPLSYWHEDFNRNRIVDRTSDVTTDERVRLYAAMRRGGRNYYSLDVSNINAPAMLWQIKGGEGDFSRLGQTWSKMTIAKVAWDNTAGYKVVGLFTGGYDPQEDITTQRQDATMGNAVYMVDAITGELLWHSSQSGSDLNISEMTSSFASDIAPVDFNADGLLDYFYAADVGGRIFRFDLNANPSVNLDPIATGGIIFDANGDNSNNYQRFYNTPSISYFTDNTSNQGYITIAIGSGYRAHPLDQSSTDKFYVLKDFNVSNTPSRYTKLTPSSLAVNGNSHAQRKRNGWSFSLQDNNEKVLSNALTDNGNIIFTTFTPKTSSVTTSCVADIGKSKSYVIDFKGDDSNGSNGFTGGPILGNPVEGGRGIIPEPVKVIVSKDGDKKFCANNPSHESCTNTTPEPEDCETGVGVVISGTKQIGDAESRCDQIKKDYWYRL